MIDVNKIDEMEFAGIDHDDYPDFCDAYIESATIWENGKERDLTDEELDWVMDNERDWFYNELNNYLF